MPPEENVLEQAEKRRISLGELREYMSGPACVGEDIFAANGVVLLPKGVELASLIASFDDLEKNLRHWGVFSIPVTIRNKLSLQELEDILRSAEANLSTIDPQLARETVEQVGNVYERIVDGMCNPEDVTQLAKQGQNLAKEVAQAPQVMLCLGRVRSWDEYTYVHSLNVALLGGFLASKLFPNDSEVAECLSAGGILHDLGKARIPKEVLNKPAALTNEEFDIIKRHPAYGEEIATSNGVTDPRILTVIRGHHERYNGKGYPDALAKERTSIEAKIAAVADVFDALTARRVYKDPIESRVAVSMMIDNMGEHFDPEVVRVLLLSIGLYPPGTAVELSDGSMGVVVGARGKDLLRPQVLLKIDSVGHKIRDIQIIDLSVNSSFYVRRSLLDVGKIAF